MSFSPKSHCLFTAIAFEVPDKLQCLEVPTLSDRDCNNAYPGSITESMFCAGYLEGGKGVCYVIHETSQCI